MSRSEKLRTSIELPYIGPSSTRLDEISELASSRCQLKQTILLESKIHQNGDITTILIHLKTSEISLLVLCKIKVNARRVKETMLCSTIRPSTHDNSPQITLWGYIEGKNVIKSRLFYYDNDRVLTVE